MVFCVLARFVGRQKKCLLLPRNCKSPSFQLHELISGWYLVPNILERSFGLCKVAGHSHLRPEPQNALLM